MPKWWRADRTGALTDRLFGVEPRDRRDATIGFLTLFLAMCGHGLMEAARDTLFLQSLPPTRLPWAYLGIAALTLAGGAFQRRFLADISPRKALRVTLLAGALAGVGFGSAPAFHVSELALLGFYVWTGLLATTIVVQFWLTVATVMDFGQAKRGFALLGAGGLLGAFFGSIATVGTLSMAPARSLPLVASAAFLAASFVARYFSPERVPLPADGAARQPADRPRRDDRYASRVLALVLLGSVTVTLVDYLFKSTVAREVPRDELGRFFARYYAAVNVSAFGVELLVTPRLLRAAGLHRLIMIMPAVILAASLGFASAGTLVWVLVLRGVDGSLRHSTNRVGVELLHLPFEGEVRAKLRTFTEAAGQRAGQGAASLLVLGSIGLGFTYASLAWVPVVLAALWLVVALRVEQVFVGRLRRQMDRKTPPRDTLDAPLDEASERALTRALGSSVESDVTAALDAVFARDRPDLVPVDLLSSSSPEVLKKVLAFEWDPRRPGTREAITKLLDHADAEVQAAALAWLIPHGASTDLLERLARGDGAALRATALVGLTRVAVDRERVAADLDELLNADDPAAVRALARAARFLPPELIPRFAPRITGGAHAEAISSFADALARVPVPAYIPTLIALLAPREARRAARTALVALGAPALDALCQALESDETPASVKLHLPRTIARFPSRKSVAVLERALSARPDQALGFKILRGLGRVRADHPELPVNRAALEEDALLTVRRAIEAACTRRAVNLSRRHLPEAGGACAELLATALAEESERALERVFRLMHILEPEGSFRVVFSAIRNGDPDLRARGREVLEHLAPPRLKRSLLAFVEEGPTSLRLQRPLGFELGQPYLRALRLEKPEGAPNARFEREMYTTLADCLKAEQRSESPLLRSLATRYLRWLPRTFGVQDAV